MIITRQTLRAWGACYTDDQIAALVPPDGVTPLQVCDAEQVPDVDRLWVLTRLEIVPADLLRLAAASHAERALRAAASTPDPRSLAAVVVAGRFARGDASDLERITARAAAARVANAAPIGDWAAAYAAMHAADADAADAFTWALGYAGVSSAGQLRVLRVLLTGAAP